MMVLSPYKTFSINKLNNFSQSVKETDGYFSHFMKMTNIIQHFVNCLRELHWLILNVDCNTDIASISCHEGEFFGPHSDDFHKLICISRDRTFLLLVNSRLYSETLAVRSRGSSSVRLKFPSLADHNLTTIPKNKKYNIIYILVDVTLEPIGILIKQKQPRETVSANDLTCSITDTKVSIKIYFISFQTQHATPKWTRYHETQLLLSALKWTHN